MFIRLSLPVPPLLVARLSNAYARHGRRLLPGCCCSLHTALWARVRFVRCSLDVRD